MNPVDTSFMEQAECRGMPAELFHPESHDYALIKAAKAVCARCPVREQCLDYALGLPPYETQGVIGGTTPKERRTLTRQRHAEGTLPPVVRNAPPLIHGTGFTAYRRCGALNGTACTVCKQGHAAEQRRAKQDRDDATAGRIDPAAQRAREDAVSQRFMQRGQQRAAKSRAS